MIPIQLVTHEQHMQRYVTSITFGMYKDSLHMCMGRVSSSRECLKLVAMVLGIKYKNRALPSLTGEPIL